MDTDEKTQTAEFKAVGRRKSRNFSSEFCIPRSAFIRVHLCSSVAKFFSSSSPCPPCLRVEPLPPAELVQLRLELVHVVLFDRQCRDEDLLAGGDHRLVAAKDLGHHRDRLTSELVRLLHDGRGD